MNTLNNIKIGFFRNNPVLSLALGLTTALAVTGSVTTALGMGILTFILVVLAAVLGAAVKKVTPKEMLIPVNLVIAAFLAKLGELFVLAFASSLATSVGVFLPLLAVNSLLLFASGALTDEAGVGESFKNAILSGCAYVAALLVVAFFRELLSTGGIILLNPVTGTEVFSFSLLSQQFTLSLFASPAGALLMTAFVGGLFQAFGKSGEEKGGN